MCKKNCVLFKVKKYLGDIRIFEKINMIQCLPQFCLRKMLHTFKNIIGIICIFSIQGQVQVLTDRLKWEKIEMNDDDFPFWHSPHLSADCCNAPFLLLWYLTLSYFFFRNAKMYHLRLLMRPFISMICYISVGYFTLQHNLHTLDWHWFILQKRS